MAIYKRDVGVTFEISTDIDLTNATSVQIMIKKPSSRSAIWPATKSVTPSDGIITYTTIDGDLNEDGWHYLQSYAEFPSSVAYYGNAVKFKVYDSYEVP